MPGFKIQFWEPSLSPHKLALIEAVANLADVEQVSIVAHEGLLSERSDQGWRLGHLPANVDVVCGPDRSDLVGLIVNSDPATFHIFSGLHWRSTLVEGLRLALSENRRVGIMSEPRASEGLAGRGRWLHSWLTEERVRRNAEFILAIGANGPAWFRATGYAHDRIFPFAYFLPPMPRSYVACEGRSLDEAIMVTWIGRLTKKKGVDQFLKALPLLTIPVHVLIAGVGELSAVVEEYAGAAKNRTLYLGKVAMDDIPPILEKTDVLVLASTTDDDGWGAVVSEALLSGAAVVATNKVGASVCLDNHDRGYIVSAGSPKAIAQAIETLAESGRFGEKSRKLRRDWAECRLTAEAGANYLLNILKHVRDGAARPRAPYE